MTRRTRREQSPRIPRVAIHSTGGHARVCTHAGVRTHTHTGTNVRSMYIRGDVYGQDTVCLCKLMEALPLHAGSLEGDDFGEEDERKGECGEGEERVITEEIEKLRENIACKPSPAYKRLQESLLLAKKLRHKNQVAHVLQVGKRTRNEERERREKEKDRKKEGDATCFALPPASVSTVIMRTDEYHRGGCMYSRHLSL